MSRLNVKSLQWRRDLVNITREGSDLHRWDKRYWDGAAGLLARLIKSLEADPDSVGKEVLESFERLALSQATRWGLHSIYEQAYWVGFHSVSVELLELLGEQ